MFRNSADNFYYSSTSGTGPLCDNLILVVIYPLLFCITRYDLIAHDGMT